jgi:predicted dehydrogenase
MNKKIKWGIIGLGRIAEKFASDLLISDNAILYSVASRNIEKAREFAIKFSAVKYFGSYKNLADDPEVDIVYIATPHVFHFENTMMCLGKGKHVLCEKPLGMDQNEVAEMIMEAKKRQLFMMEGIWTRFIPATEKLLDLLEGNIIGDLIMVHADFGFKAELKPDGRVYNKALGGGSLMDVGIYPVYLSLITMGRPSVISAKSGMTETGVDAYCSMKFEYESNSAISFLESSIVNESRTEAIIFGTKGLLLMHNRFHHTEKLSLYNNGSFKTIFETNNIGFGYIYEIKEVNKCLLNNKTESEKLPHYVSHELSKILDQVKMVIGLNYSNRKKDYNL